MKTRGSRLTIRGGIEAGTVRRRRWALSGALALALFAGLSRPSATLAAEGSDTTTEDNEQAARRHFAEGDAAFKAGHYDDALKEFEAGYAVSRRPGFLLNMAHTQRKLGHLREARSLYKKYLLVDANSKLRDEVRSVIPQSSTARSPTRMQAERDRKDRGAAGSGTAAGEAAGSSIAAASPAVSPPAATTLPTAPRPGAEPPVVLQQSAGSTMDERGSSSPPFYQRGWFWVAVGAIALTGAGAAIYLSRRPGTDPFHDSGTLGSLGN